MKKPAPLSVTPSSVPSRLPGRDDDDDVAADGEYKRASNAHRSFQKIPIKLRKHFQHLRFLSKASPAVRKKFILHAPESFLDCCSELCVNYCAGRIDCTRTQKKRLARYKSQLRELADRRTGDGARRRILQRGGFLPALAIPIISAVGGLLPSLIDWIRGK